MTCTLKPTALPQSFPAAGWRWRICGLVVRYWRFFSRTSDLALPLLVGRTPGCRVCTGKRWGGEWCLPVFCSEALPSEQGHAMHTLLNTVFKPYWDHSCLTDEECWCKQHCCYFWPEEGSVCLKACLFFPNCNSWSNKRYCLSLKILNCITVPLFCSVWIRL